LGFPTGWSFTTHQPHSLLRLEATQGGNLKVLKMKTKHSINVRIINGVNFYTKALVEN
jgi:hypothetical protein